MKYSRSGCRFLFRLRHGFSKGAKVLLWLLGLSATALTLASFAGIAGNRKFISILISISIVGSFVYGTLVGRIDHLPDEIIVCDDADEKYDLCFEPKNVCLEFNRETALYFGRDYLAEAVVEGWWLKNPKAFIYLRNAKKEPCAALCMFALQPSFMEQFIKGRIADADIEPEDILEYDASRKANYLYLAAILIKDPHTQIGHRRAVAMVWAVTAYLKKIFGTRKSRTIYAIPVNKKSENLLKRLGFEFACSSYLRKDKHDLYSFELTATSLREALNRIGDHSSYCSINLS